MRHSRYKALLLDFYGTLVKEDGEIIHRIVTTIAERSSITNDPKQIINSWNFSELCARACGSSFKSQRDIEQDSLICLLEEYKADLDAEELSAELFAYWQKPEAFPSASRFLESINIPVCIVSNIDRDDLDNAIEHNGWEFINVVTSEECRAYKPRPEPFIAGLNVLGLRPEDVLHVGDSLSGDVAGAANLGIDCVWINPNDRILQNDDRYKPTYVVNDVVEVSDIIS